jgi:hypothetical protein
MDLLPQCSEEPDGLSFWGVAYIEGPLAPLTGVEGLLKAAI